MQQNESEDIIPASKGWLKYANMYTCLALVILVTLAISFQKYFSKHELYNGGGSIKTRYNNYLLFKYSFYHLMQQKDLYIMDLNEAWDYYKYSPSFALLFAPFALLPDGVGLVLWNLVNVLVFFFALWQFPFYDYKKKVLAFAFIFIELTTAVHSSQSNPLIAGLILFAFLFFEKKNFFIGTLFIVLSVYIKLFGAVAFLLILFYPERWKAMLYSAFWMIIFAALPLLVVSFGQLKFLYVSWFNLLAHDTPVSDSFSVMGLLHTWFHVEANPFVLLTLGVILLCIPMVRVKLYNNFYFKATMLASILTWVIIFNHKAESPTFVIAVTGIAVWYFIKPKTSITDTVLLFLALVFTVLSPTDIFPRYLRDNLVLPYSLKVFPCILIWVKMVYELVTGTLPGENNEEAIKL